MYKKVSELTVKLFADGAQISDMLDMYPNPNIKGFTTNPTLMQKAGVTDYVAYSKEILAAITDRPISFEVFSDDFEEMYKQAIEIASWGKNVYVKIPVTNTKGEPSRDLVEKLVQKNVNLNVTALFTVKQVEEVVSWLQGTQSSCISVFAGRVADTGRDPLPIMKRALEIMKPYPEMELIWASPRELLNIYQADEIGCHIITVTYDVLRKLDSVGKDLNQFSLETVKMFFDDATKAGFKIQTS
jgi:transaldolase